MTRLGVWISHPIQYYSPWFRYLAARLNIEVCYAHRQDAKGQAEAGFGVEIDWDTPLLQGYPHRWLRNVARRPSVRTFRGCDTPEIYDLLRERRFDAFLIFGWNRMGAIQTVRACRRSGVPVLMRGDSQLQVNRSRSRSTLKYIPYRWFLPRLDAHLWVGQRNRQYLSHYGVPASRLFFAPHFVDNEFFVCRAEGVRRAGADLELRHQLGVPEESLVILFVGKLIAVKRPGDFVEACLRLLNQPGCEDLHGIVVGDGPLRRDLQCLSKAREDRIHFVGFQNQTELPRFYCAADALIVPGLETWGLVANEAIACGTPIVVNERAGCAPDLVEKGQTGYTFGSGDIGALAQRILELRGQLRTNPAAIARALSQKTSIYSMEKATEGLEEALEAVKSANI